MPLPWNELLDTKAVVGDGAMGTLLYERGVYPNRNFDELCLSQPELVARVHHDYLHAGAALLETNTYGANRVRLTRHGLEEHVEAINRAAVDLCRRASEGVALVAGSMGPTGLSLGELRRREQEVRDAYAEQAGILVEGGADLLVLETFGQPFELRIAVQATRAVTDRPIVAMVKPTDEGGIADGSDPRDLALEMREWGADVVGANCNGPGVIYDVTRRMVESGLPVAAFPNAGKPERIEDRFIYLATPESFGVYARRMYKAGVSLVGGCCGTGPLHVHRVAAAARMLGTTSTFSVPTPAPSKGLAPLPLEVRSPFGAALGRRFVVSVEINPGRDLSLAAEVEAARAVLAAGADAINIADGPRATARVGNLALAVRLLQELRAEVLLHVCTRDRNTLGLLSHLLGAHALGLRNLVLVTGDPPKLGDFPDATAVYDLDSIGLIRMAADLNRGLDPAGKSIGEQTRFVLATGVEPEAADLERELLRLRDKAAAGAELVMTQPIYDAARLDRVLALTRSLGLRLMAGVLPLASHRNAEFLHRHVPGMTIPEAIRERMRKSGSGKSARKEGVRIALETIETLRDRIDGVYLMPPLGHHEMAIELLEAIARWRGAATPS